MVPGPLFLLSPAFCGGRRSAMLLREAADLPLAAELRAGRLSLGAAFAFLSGLYFRGKLAYGQAFGRGTRQVPGTLIITPTRGLLRPEHPVNAALLREFAAGDVSLDNPRYREPLDRDVAALSESLDPDVRVVLLGSVATGKYVDVLGERLADRLYFPAAFVGRGDMSRGGLLLRAVAAAEELAYERLRAGVRPTGPRPPRLTPLGPRSAAGDEPPHPVRVARPARHRAAR